MELKQRVATSMPQIFLIDMKSEQTNFGLSQSLISAMQACFTRKEQVILLLNRRGYLPVMRCMDCNATLTCPDCGLALAYHKRIINWFVIVAVGFFLIKRSVQTAMDIIFTRAVWEPKTGRRFKSLFPQQKIIRMDADTTRKKMPIKNS